MPNCGIYGCGSGSAPNSYTLPTSGNPVAVTWEPGNGQYPNYGPGTSHNDDANYAYGVYSDHNFLDWCGPGAADIALWYWPAAPSLETTTEVDLSYYVKYDTNVYTTWNSERMRGYMSYLAWDMYWPDGPHAGMLDDTAYPTDGTTLYGMQDALNWEASGHGSDGYWVNYFYIITWWSDVGTTEPVVAAALHNDVVDDVWYNGVPVVPEVDASYLPNWKGQTGNVHHSIVIIGYDDVHSTYTYVDTCGYYTGCNQHSANTDGKTHTVSQTTLVNAIMAIPVNKSTAPNAGDGGWVW